MEGWREGKDGGKGGKGRGRGGAGVIINVPCAYHQVPQVHAHVKCRHTQRHPPTSSGHADLDGSTGSEGLRHTPAHAPTPTPTPTRFRPS